MKSISLEEDTFIINLFNVGIHSKNKRLINKLSKFDELGQIREFLKGSNFSFYEELRTIFIDSHAWAQDGNNEYAIFDGSTTDLRIKCCIFKSNGKTFDYRSMNIDAMSECELIDAYMLLYENCFDGFRHILNFNHFEGKINHSKMYRLKYISYNEAYQGLEFEKNERSLRYVRKFLKKYAESINRFNLDAYDCKIVKWVEESS